MEVHAHSHTERKKWTHYLWEFLMLFLAVFCGFLAEYQLEHFIEKQRAKEFTISLQRDLAADTTFHNNTLSALNICIRNIDTLIEILGNTNELEKNTASIYRLSVYAFISPTSRANESTMQQLLNSGSLRYFKNNQLVDTIKIYNTNVQSLNVFNEAVTNFNTEFRKEQVKIIEINPMISFMNENDFLGEQQIKTDTALTLFKNRKLLTTNETMIKEYANWCALKKFYLANNAAYTARVKDYAVAVLRMLNK
jgi:hypothetical protein